MRQDGSSSHGVNTTPEVTQYVGCVMGISSDQDRADGHHLMVEAASPISSRPPAARQDTLDELEPADQATGAPNDDDPLAREEAERGATSGNRWPRPETLTLLKIRSDMDAVFREATLKGPLWEDVSRKMAGMGYNRSAKKCKEKFENVQKYYKRTKEGRARRQDGKSYRFFTQLEALHGTTTTSTTQALNYAPPAAAGQPPPQTVTHMINSNPASWNNNNNVFTPTTTTMQTPASIATPITSNQPICSPVMPMKRASTDMNLPGTSLSSGGSSDSSESSEETQGDNHRKRPKLSNSSELSTSEMMKFFKDLMKKVVEEQVAMQQRLLEAVEKREEERMVREEAWRKQEMARLSHELDILAQERVLSASRDAAVISLLQKFTGPAAVFPPPPPPPTQWLPPPSPKTTIPVVRKVEADILPPKQPNHHHHHQEPLEQPEHPQSVETIRPINEACRNTAVPDPETTVVNFDLTSSRWPKVEVLALIKLRSGLEPRYQEAGPKGPLWEEISAEMAKMGYQRSAKRCKEKWENINKYFKKVKESNKKRHMDSKTCPYFHELEALHRKKMLGGTPTKPEPDPPELIPAPEKLGCNRMQIMPMPILVAVPSNSVEEMRDMEHGVGNNGGSEMHMHSTGFISTTGAEGNVVTAKKPEDIVRDLMEKRQQHQAVMDEYAKMDDPDDDDDSDVNSTEEDFEDGQDCYEARYRNQNGPGMARGSDSFVTMIG